MYPPTCCHDDMGRGLGDYALFPKRVSWESGLWPDRWEPGDTSQYGSFNPSSPIYDPNLGFFLFDAAKAIGKAAYGVGKGVVSAIPRAVQGFATGGVPGLIAAGGTSLISTWTKATPDQKRRLEQAVAERVYNTGGYGGGNDQIGIAADAVWNAALQRGGQMIAQTPSGQRGIAQEAKAQMGDYIKPMLLPAAAIVGVLLLTRK